MLPLTGCDEPEFGCPCPLLLRGLLEPPFERGEPPPDELALPPPPPPPPPPRLPPPDGEDPEPCCCGLVVVPDGSPGSDGAGGGVSSSIGMPGSPGTWLIGTPGGASTVTVTICPVARRTRNVRSSADAGRAKMISARTAATIAPSPQRSRLVVRGISVAESAPPRSKSRARELGLAPRDGRNATRANIRLQAGTVSTKFARPGPTSCGPLLPTRTGTADQRGHARLPFLTPTGRGIGFNHKP